VQSIGRFRGFHFGCVPKIALDAALPHHHRLKFRRLAERRRRLGNSIGVEPLDGALSRLFATAAQAILLRWD
jgi:hypothetical protein